MTPEKRLQTIGIIADRVCAKCSRHNPYFDDLRRILVLASCTDDFIEANIGNFPEYDIKEENENIAKSQ